MKPKLRITIGLIVISLLLLILFGEYLGSKVEMIIWKSKANAAITKISSPSIPIGFGGEQLKFKDGWLVILYGQSTWLEHGAWNYNIAKDSKGNVYVSNKHFCSSIRCQGQMYIDSKKHEVYLQNDELEDMAKLITSDKLDDALISISRLQFYMIENAANK